MKLSEELKGFSGKVLAVSNYPGFPPLNTPAYSVIYAPAKWEMIVGNPYLLHKSDTLCSIDGRTSIIQYITLYDFIKGCCAGNISSLEVLWPSEDRWACTPPEYANPSLIEDILSVSPLISNSRMAWDKLNYALSELKKGMEFTMQFHEHKSRPIHTYLRTLTGAFYFLRHHRVLTEGKVYQEVEHVITCVRKGIKVTNHRVNEAVVNLYTLAQKSCYPVKEAIKLEPALFTEVLSRAYFGDTYDLKIHEEK